MYKNNAWVKIDNPGSHNVFVIGIHYDSNWVKKQFDPFQREQIDEKTEHCGNIGPVTATVMRPRLRNGSQLGIDLAGVGTMTA
jgi:hypothetical protein